MMQVEIVKVDVDTHFFVYLTDVTDVQEEGLLKL